MDATYLRDRNAFCCTRSHRHLIRPYPICNPPVRHEQNCVVVLHGYVNRKQATKTSAQKEITYSILYAKKQILWSNKREGIRVILRRQF